MKCCALPTLTSTSTGNGNGNDPPLRIPRKGILWSVTDVTVTVTVSLCGRGRLLLLAAACCCGPVRCCGSVLCEGTRNCGTAERLGAPGAGLVFISLCLLFSVLVSTPTAGQHDLSSSSCVRSRPIPAWGPVHPRATIL
jgi:hypothetical protein